MRHDITTNNDRTLTFWCYAKRNDAAQIERLLVDALVPVDDINDLGETALHLAASRGHDDVVRILLQHNANLVAKDWESGWTPLHRSVFHDRLSTTLLLLRHARLHFGKTFMHSYLHSVRDVANQSALELLSARLADEYASINNKRTGAVYTFGKADFQLGYHLPNADVQTFPRIVDIPSRSSIVQISASKYHTLALDASGACFVWGFGKGGRLGTGTDFDHVEPIRIASFLQIPIAQVAAGENHSLAVATNGHVYSWGANSFGQLGQSVKTSSLQSRATPKRIDALRNVAIAHIAVSSVHSAAICQTDGVVYTWGSNRKGQLGRKDGLGTDAAASIPKSIDALRAQHPLSALGKDVLNVVALQLALSDAHTSVVLQCKRTDDPRAARGQVWQVGYGSAHPTRIKFLQSTTQSTTLSEYWTPEHRQRGVDIVAVACAQHHSIALDASGTVFTWGHTLTALSHARSSSRDVQLRGAPQRVDLTSYGRVTSISASMDHCAVVTATGDLVTWGCGAQNVLGHGHQTTWQPKPKRVVGTKKAIAVATGQQHTAVLIAPYAPSAAVSTRTTVPTLLALLQQHIATHVDLFNCATLWKYAAALATPQLEAFAFEYMRLNWDAILEIVGGRDRLLDGLFELLLLPPLARVTQQTAVRVGSSTTCDKRVEKRKSKRDVASEKLVVSAAIPADESARLPVLPPDAASVVSHTTDAAATTRAPVPFITATRRKTAKFVSLDKFFEPLATSKATVAPAAAAVATSTTMHDYTLQRPWTTARAATTVSASSVSPQQQRTDSTAAAAAVASSPMMRPRVPSVGDNSASPRFSVASPSLRAISSSSLLLAQDGSERQLLSTFSLDAFLKKPSRNGSRKKSTTGTNNDPTIKPLPTPSWQLARAPAKTLAEIQREEEVRAAQDAAAKAGNGGYKRNASTVNSWGLCEAQRHVSLTDVQQSQRDLEFVEQQRQILAQIERERAVVAQQSQTRGPAATRAGTTRASTARSGARTNAGDSAATATTRRAAKKSDKQQQQQIANKQQIAVDDKQVRIAGSEMSSTTSSKKRVPSKKKAAMRASGDNDAPKQFAPAAADATLISSTKSKKPKKSKARTDRDRADGSAPAGSGDNNNKSERESRRTTAKSTKRMSATSQVPPSPAIVNVSSGVSAA